MEESQSNMFGRKKGRTRIPKINLPLVPVKAQQFFYFGGVHSVLPYVSLHLKRAGLNTADITIISSFLPLFGSLGPTVIGFCTDRIGRYKPVATFVILVTAAIFSSILLIPSFGRITKPLEANVSCYADQNLVFVEKCGRKDSCNFTLSSVALERCRCSNSSTPNGCDTAASWLSLNESKIRITADLMNKHAFRCVYQIKEVYRNEDNYSLNSNKLCSHRCAVAPPSTCQSVVGQWEHTFWSLLVARLMAQFFMASSFNVVDTTMMGALKRHGGDYGKHRVWVHVAQVVFPFLSGALMDVAGSGAGKPARWPAYLLMDICFFVVILLLLPMTLHQEKMQGSNIKNLKQLTTDRRCVVLFVLAFFFGIAPGFLAVFLPIFLQNRKSPMYIIGLTSTSSSVTSIILMFFSDGIVGRVGHMNVLCLGFLVNALRLFCFSILEVPQWAILLETTKSFSQHLCWVALVKWASALSPKGLLSTTLGTIRASAYGAGRAFGIAIGGALVVQLGERRTFQVFAGGHIGLGLIWFLLYHYLLKRRIFGDDAVKQAAQNQDEAESKLTSSTANKATADTKVTSTNEDQAILLTQNERLLSDSNN